MVDSGTGLRVGSDTAGVLAGFDSLALDPVVPGWASAVQEDLNPAGALSAGKHP